MTEREDSPRDIPARLVRLEDRCVLDFLAASLEEPGIVMGDVDELDAAPASSRSVADPKSASVERGSRFEDEGVDPPDDWLRRRRPNSVLYMLCWAWCDSNHPCLVLGEAEAQIDLAWCPAIRSAVRGWIDRVLEMCEPD